MDKLAQIRQALADRKPGEVAKRCGLSKATVCSALKEHPKHALSAQTVAKLSAYLGIQDDVELTKRMADANWVPACEYWRVKFEQATARIEKLEAKQ